MASQKALQPNNTIQASPACVQKSGSSKKLNGDHQKENSPEFPSLESTFEKTKGKRKGSKKHKKPKPDESQLASPTLEEGLEQSELLNESQVKSGSSKKRKVRHALEILENLLPKEESQSGDPEPIGDSLSQISAKKAKKKKQVHFEAKPGNCSQLDQQQIPSAKSSKKKRLPTEPGSLSSSLSSPDNLPKDFLEDKTAKGEDTSDYSQDLFITQKKFLPSALLNGSQDSPPQGQKRHKKNSNRGGSQNSSNEPLSQSSCRREDAPNVKSEFGEAIVEKATQTEDLFSYLSLMTYLKRIKVVEVCSEKPLNLALKSRVRASNSHKGRVKEEEEIIVVSSSSPHSPLERKLQSGMILTPPNRFDDSKFVQTILNSSYFFKGKGENGELSPTPLIKMKEEEKPQKSARKLKSKKGSSRA